MQRPRSKNESSATPRAIGLQPTQITPRQLAWIPNNNAHFAGSIGVDALVRLVGQFRSSFCKNRLVKRKAGSFILAFSSVTLCLSQRHNYTRQIAEYSIKQL